MDTSVTRNFKVRGKINALFAPNGGAPSDKLVSNMQVELWHKGPMETVFLGKGFTAADGEFIVEFQMESPTEIIIDGEIKDVFMKVYYNGKMLIGDLDAAAGSFD